MYVSIRARQAASQKTYVQLAPGCRLKAALGLLKKATYVCITTEPDYYYYYNVD